MIKEIIFDFDGTLVDSSGLTLDLINIIGAKNGLPSFTVEELRVMNTLPIPERLNKVDIPLYRIPRLMLEYLALYKQSVASLKMIEGMGELITALKGDGFRLSILSSNSTEAIAEFLRSNRLDQFDHIISAKGLFQKHKYISKLLKENKLKPDEVLYVGDELRDAEACKKASVRMIAVLWGFDSPQLLFKGNPDFTAAIPGDIREIALRLQAL